MNQIQLTKVHYCGRITQFLPNFKSSAKFPLSKKKLSFYAFAYDINQTSNKHPLIVQMSRAEAHLGVSPAAPSQDEPALTLEQVKKKTKKNFGTAEKKLKKTLEAGKKTKKIWNR